MSNGNSIEATGIKVNPNILVSRGPDVIEIPLCKPFIYRKPIISQISQAVRGDKNIELYHYHPDTHELEVIIPQTASKQPALLPKGDDDIH